MPCLALALLLVLPVQDQGEASIVDPAKGITVLRPPSNKSKELYWKLKKGEGAKLFKDTDAVLSIVGEEFTVEVNVDIKNDNETFGELKEIAERIKESFKESGGTVEVKIDPARTQFVCATGSFKAVYAEVTLKDKGVVQLKFREWVFFGKSKNQLFRIYIVGSDEAVKKFESDLGVGKSPAGKVFLQYLRVEAPKKR